MPITDPDWVDPIEMSFDVEKPIRSDQGLTLAGNPIAMANGKPGAPRIKFEALDPSISAIGDLGSVAFLGRNISPGLYANPGSVIAGSQLQYAGIIAATTATQVVLSGTNPAGTWRCMGIMNNASGTGANVATLWIRIT